MKIHSKLALLCSLTVSTCQADTTGFQLSSATSRISHQAVAATTTSIRIDSVDLAQNRTVNDVDRLLRLYDQSQVFSGSGTILFPAGKSHIFAQISGESGQSHFSLDNFSGPLRLQAVQANAPTILSNTLPLTVVENYLQGSLHPDFKNQTPVGTPLNAFTLRDATGQVAVAQVLHISHIDEGLQQTAVREIIPNAVSDAQGILNLSFTQATGTLTTRSDEYYLLTPADDNIAQMLINNVGHDGNADLVASIASQVKVVDTQEIALAELSVQALDNNYILDLSTLNFRLDDNFGNPITRQNVEIDSSQFTTIAEGILNPTPSLRMTYPSTFQRDRLTLHFTQPANLAPVTFDVSRDTALPKLDSFSVNPTFEIQSSQTLFSGGSQIFNTSQRLSLLKTTTQSPINTQIRVLPAVEHRGLQAKPIVLVYLGKPDGEALWWDWLANQMWDVNPATLGISSTPIDLNSNTLNLLDIDFQYGAFAGGNRILWIAGYRLLGSEILHLSFVEMYI